MPFKDFFKSSIDRSLHNGSLALFANLLFEALCIGWIIFSGLYLVEAILPTFIIARLSLVKFSIFLVLATLFLAVMRTYLPAIPKDEKGGYNRLWWIAVLFFLAAITLAHYRFPWWSIPLTVGGYLTILWLFQKNNDSVSSAPK